MHCVESRPVRARGLKQFQNRYYIFWQVAPRAGAWIETDIAPVPPFTPKSRPVRARGLKRMIQRKFNFVEVAPRAGAWIETKVVPKVPTQLGRAPCGRVD